MGESLECITVTAPALPVDYVVTGVFDNDMVTVVVERRLLQDVGPDDGRRYRYRALSVRKPSSSSTVALSSPALTVCVSSYTVSRSTVTVNSNSCVVEPVFVSRTPASRALAGLSAERPERAKSVPAVRTLRLEGITRYCSAVLQKSSLGSTQPARSSQTPICAAMDETIVSHSETPIVTLRAKSAAKNRKSPAPTK